MNLLKKSERMLKAQDIIKTYKTLGMTHSNLGTYCKWKELSIGGQLQVSLTIHKFSGNPVLTNGAEAIYFLEDALGRVACQIISDKQEVMSWLKEHGYKTEKRWYIEDYGISEETWKAWNAGEEEEA